MRLKEETKYKLITYPLIFLFGGVFVPLATFLQPVHQNENLTLFGIVGMCCMIFPSAIYVMYLCSKPCNDRWLRLGNCRICKWYYPKLGKTETKSYCHRFPKKVKVDAYYFCGEFDEQKDRNFD